MTVILARGGSNSCLNSAAILNRNTCDEQKKPTSQRKGMANVLAEAIVVIIVRALDLLNDLLARSHLALRGLFRHDHNE
jgi:hypothetical protein